MPPEKKRKKGGRVDLSTNDMEEPQSGRIACLDASSPSVLLSHVARRLGLPEPIYRSHNHPKMPLSPITVSIIHWFENAQGISDAINW